MKSKKMFLIIAVIISFVILTCCLTGGYFAFRVFDSVTKSINDQGTSNDFYNQVSGWDYERIALIEPYQVIKITNSWQITSTQNSNIRGSANNIKQLDVENKMIFAYGENSIYKGTSYTKIWYVINPETDEVKTFFSENDFLQYLKDSKNEQVSLVDVDELYSILVDKRKLNWYPMNDSK